MKEIQHKTKRTPEAIEIPNLVEIQLDSYNWFLREGLKELFDSFSPIHDFTGNFSLEFLDYSLGEPKYTLEECRYRDMTTFEAPIKARVRLTPANKEVIESEVYLGDLPAMTDKGTFVINGAERVVVSQLARSPGVYFKENMDLSGRVLYFATIIPNSGAWIDVETDSNDVITVHVAQSKKFPLTTLLRALCAFPQSCPDVETVPLTEAIGRTLAENVVNQKTGEVIVETGTVIDARVIRRLQSNRVRKTAWRSEDTHAQTRKVSTKDDSILGSHFGKDTIDVTTGELLFENGSLIDAAVLEKLRERGIDEVMVAVERGMGHSHTDKVVVEYSGPTFASTKDILDYFGKVRTIKNPEATQITGRRAAQDVNEEKSGKPLVKATQRITDDFAKKIEKMGLESIQVYELHQYIDATIEEDGTHNPEEAMVDIFKKIRPGDPATHDSTLSLINSYFFDTRRYDMARVGRYKVNKKLGLSLPEEIKWITRDDIVKIMEYLVGLSDAGSLVAQFNKNNLTKRLPELEEAVKAYEAQAKSDEEIALAQVYTDSLEFLQNLRFGGMMTELRIQQVKDTLELIPNGTRLVAESPAELFTETAIRLSPCTVDDIDHLENKRVRSVGELLQDQLRMGFLRMEKVAKERMTSLDSDNVIPNVVLSVKPISASIKSFFGSSQLSQFMDQTNPLAELTHKRRLSALGPGGLSRQSAKLEVRDVHRSHYGRICPIETPEGPNIGLIGSMAIHARIDDYGFLRTPYRIVKGGKVTEEIIYLSADEEAQEYVAPANTPYDEVTGEVLLPLVTVRHEEKYPQVPSSKLTYIEVSPKQIMSVAAALIPFLENDDANRALMGSNMQRQAVPLLRADAPIVRTGIEGRAAKDSGAVILAKRAGVVKLSTADRISVEAEDGTVDSYRLINLLRSNQGTCITQKPIVNAGDRVKRGAVLADGPCTENGELALGQNILVAFMPWNGYNYEDAILLSERLVKDDVFSSIHIEKFETEARDTKLGPEEITRDIPNVGEDVLKDLDEHGVIRSGAEVRPEDVLVGKVAPKGQGELTAEERLIIAIFGKKAEETRDVSLRVPHGESGTVVDVKVFSRFKYKCSRPECGRVHDFSKKPDRLNCEVCDADLERIAGDELNAGVNQLVRVYIAQKRKVMEGDKMAGRHGNKGVISKILPEADMPHLPDGTPVDIVLNPLGVPSRMNIGQILETHQGLAGKHLGCFYRNPIFMGSTEKEILADLDMVAWKLRIGFLRQYVKELGLDVQVPNEREVDRLIKKLLGRVSTTAKEQLDDLSKPLRDIYNTVLEGIRDLMKAMDAAALEIISLKLGGSPAVDDPEALRVGLAANIDTANEMLQDSDNDINPEYYSWERNLPFEGVPAPPDYDYEDLVHRIDTNVHKRCGLNADTGKCTLYDGRTGEKFQQPVTIGFIYMLKLAHLVEDKIHARSTGPYSLVTQQPLGGKAQFGGQRFGEMEVWALEAYGAAFTLQEILTIKSDDVQGRVKTYESIVKGENIMEPGVPESFKILINELQSLCLRVTVEDNNGKTIDLKDNDDETSDRGDGGVISGRRRKKAEEFRGGF